MKKARSDKDLMPEYDFSKGIRGKYANTALQERIRPNKALQTGAVKKAGVNAPS